MTDAKPTTYMLNKGQAFQLAKKLVDENNVDGFNQCFMLMTPTVFKRAFDQARQDERNKVLEEVDRLQKECAESDGLIDGVTVLHKLRTKLSQLKGTDEN